MKSGLVLMAISALLVVSGIASAKEGRDVPPYTHQTVQDSGQMMTQDNANGSDEVNLIDVDVK